MYSTNDWRSYELYHAKRHRTWQKWANAKWVWPEGNNSPEYNKWYYQAHKAYILARAKARRLGHILQNKADRLSGENARTKLETAKKRLNAITKSAIEKYGSKYLESPEYIQAVDRVQRYQAEYDKTLKGMVSNIQAKNASKERAKEYQAESRKQQRKRDTTHMINEFLGKNAKIRLDIANKRVGDKTTKTTNKQLALAKQKAAQDAYNRTPMGMVENAQNTLTNTFNKYLGKYLPKKKQ